MTYRTLIVAGLVFLALLMLALYRAKPLPDRNGAPPGIVTAYRYPVTPGVPVPGVRLTSDVGATLQPADAPLR